MSWPELSNTLSKRSLCLIQNPPPHRLFCHHSAASLCLHMDSMHDYFGLQSPTGHNCSPVLLWQSSWLALCSISPEKLKGNTHRSCKNNIFLLKLWKSVEFSEDALSSKNLFLLMYLPYSLVDITCTQVTENSKGRGMCRKREGFSLKSSS